MATKKVESKIEIPAMDFRMATLHVVGDSPLIVHAWSEKAKRMMLEKQMKKATKGKECARGYGFAKDKFVCEEWKEKKS